MPEDVTNRVPKTVCGESQGINRLAQATRETIEDLIEHATIHRGITAATLTKDGAAGDVSRYTPGTNTLSGTTDSVLSQLFTVPSGRRVLYVKNGDNFYLLGYERLTTTVTPITDFADGGSFITGTSVSVEVESAGTPSTANKIPLTTCPS